MRGERDKNRVGRRTRSVAVIHIEIYKEGILAGNCVVEANQAKILANFPLGIADRLGGSRWQTVRQQLRPIRRRPEVIGVRQHARLEIGNGNVCTAVRAGICRGIGNVARHQALTGQRIRHERDAAYRQPFPKSFIVSEQECFVLLERTAQRSSKLIPLERRGANGVIEEVPGIQSAIAKILERISVPLVRN